MLRTCNIHKPTPQNPDRYLKVTSNTSTYLELGLVHMRAGENVCQWLQCGGLSWNLDFQQSCAVSYGTCMQTWPPGHHCRILQFLFAH